MSLQFDPLDVLSTLLCVWQTDLKGLHQQAPLPSGFWLLSANERPWQKTRDKEKNELSKHVYSSGFLLARSLLDELP